MKRSQIQSWLEALSVGVERTKDRAEKKFYRQWAYALLAVIF